MVEVISVILIVLGAIFFLAGTLGLLRFPDIFSRLHALTKADNLGLGFIASGLALQADDLFVAIKLLLVWLVAMLAASTSAQLVALHAHGEETRGDWE